MALDKKHYEEQGAIQARRDMCTDREHSDNAHKPGTWQAKAWQEGYNLERAKLEAQVQKDPGPAPAIDPRLKASRLSGKHVPLSENHPFMKEPREALQKAAGSAYGYHQLPRAIHSMEAALEASRKLRFAHWPEGASEHLRQLSISLALETNVKRMDRLFRSAGRMVRRYGNAKDLSNGLHLTQREFERVHHRTLSMADRVFVDGKLVIDEGHYVPH